MIRLGAFFLKFGYWAIQPAHLRAFVYFLGPFGGAPLATKWREKNPRNLFSGFGPFFLKK
jgi:hypothetical protein